MGTEDAPVCPRHPGDVRMLLRSLHSDRGRPDQVLAVYACPDCGFERRLPINVHPDGGDVIGFRGVFPLGAS
jgi:hypothetical protein